MRGGQHDPDQIRGAIHRLLLRPDAEITVTHHVEHERGDRPRVPGAEMRGIVARADAELAGRCVPSLVLGVDEHQVDSAGRRRAPHHLGDLEQHRHARAAVIRSRHRIRPMQGIGVLVAVVATVPVREHRDAPAARGTEARDQVAERERPAERAVGRALSLDLPAEPCAFRHDLLAGRRVPRRSRNARPGLDLMGDPRQRAGAVRLVARARAGQQQEPEQGERQRPWSRHQNVNCPRSSTRMFRRTMSRSRSRFWPKPISACPVTLLLKP